ncbi:hypothetical protein UFB30_11115 [Jeotgalibacillus sp. HH7-29]|uniref:Uncharacterized protein n=1 Tax=Jeotgalibacillus haloalkalitolerans TaxID=3104292 RepID=A0ABU5KNE0_9BACL|nr:hypothetical protein [Jeotgalibacillus sp. HH7-29]
MKMLMKYSTFNNEHTSQQSGSKEIGLPAYLSVGLVFKKAGEFSLHFHVVKDDHGLSSFRCMK